MRLGNFTFPESVFNDHFQGLNTIIKQRLNKRQILDSVQYQKGNIVLATNIPSKQKQPNSTSRELQMTVSGLYYVKDIHPAYLRLIGLFDGDERTLPCEFCMKIKLHNLAQLLFQLQSLQIQKIA